MTFTKSIEVPTFRWFIGIFAVCMFIFAALGWAIWIMWSLYLLIDAAIRQNEPLAIYAFIVTVLGCASFGYLVENMPKRKMVSDATVTDGQEHE